MQRQADLCVSGQPGLQSEYQDYTEKPFLKKQKKKTSRCGYTHLRKEAETRESWGLLAMQSGQTDKWVSANYALVFLFQDSPQYRAGVSASS